MSFTDDDVRIALEEFSDASTNPTISHQHRMRRVLMAGAARVVAERDGAYHERNQVVAALSKLFPAGVTRTDIPGWDTAWHGCVFIDLPTGQVSWHFHDREAALFSHLPAYTKAWDGHDTQTKYERVAALPPKEPR